MEEVREVFVEGSGIHTGRGRNGGIHRVSGWTGNGGRGRWRRVLLGKCRRRRKSRSPVVEARSRGVKGDIQKLSPGRGNVDEIRRYDLGDAWDLS
jgi:hypothetical protein